MEWYKTMKITRYAFKAARALLDLEQKDVEVATGIPRQRISSFETGNADIGRKTYDKLREYYEAHGIVFLEHDGIRRKSNTEYQILSGTQGIRAFYDDVYKVAAEEGGDFAIFNGVPSELVKWAGNQWYKQHAKRMTAIKENYHFRVIVEEDEKNLIGQEFVTYGWIPKDKFNDKTIYIYGSNVAFLIFDNNDLNIILIRNKDIAKSQRILFNSVWENLASMEPL